MRGGLRFEFEGKLYTIEFHREHKQVQVKDKQIRGVRRFVKSKYPYTYVEVREHTDPANLGTYNLVVKAEQGCCPEDKFTLEEGRLRVLKKATPDLPKELRGLVWDTYLNRQSRGTKASDGGATPVDQPEVDPVLPFEEIALGSTMVN